MTTTNINIDLGGFAAGTLENLAESIEAALAQLDRLTVAGGPGADRDDADFQIYQRQICAALQALRGNGLLLTDEQARNCRHLWEAAYAVTSQDLTGHPRAWYGAVQCLDTVLPHVEVAV